MNREFNELDWTGYVLSTQEMILFGQGPPFDYLEDQSRYLGQHYKLLGIIQGKLTVEQAREKRVSRTHSQAFAKYFGLEVRGSPRNPGCYIVNISLEPTDEAGNTIRDPQPLDENLKPISDYQKSLDFPFRRD